MTEPRPQEPSTSSAGSAERAPAGDRPGRSGVAGPGGRAVAGTDRRGAGRSALVFAIVGVVLALVAGGLYLYRTANLAAGETPDAAVRRFLAQVSLSGDADRLPGADVVCSTWDPTGAVVEMAQQVGPEMDVSWDNIAVLRQTDGEATVLARLNLYRYGQARPSGQRQWRFSLVDEDGWRVCGASSLAP